MGAIICTELHAVCMGSIDGYVDVGGIDGYTYHFEGQPNAPLIYLRSLYLDDVPPAHRQLKSLPTVS